MDYNSQTLAKSVLGYFLKLGQLYDCRSDRPEDGASLPLWDIKDGVRILDKHSTSYDIDLEDSVSHRSSALNMDADLKLSIAAGVASARGSGKFIENKKDSKREVRVTLQHKYRSRVEELTMDTIMAESRKGMLRYHLATHVVTAVEYGVDNIFTFSGTLSESADFMDLQASIKAKILWWIKVADVEYRKLKNEGNKDDTITCIYNGDLKLDNHSKMTLAEAMIKFREMPTSFDLKKESVPKRIWLMPLTVIDSSAPRLVKTISNKLATQTQNLLEEIHHVIVEAKNLRDLANAATIKDEVIVNNIITQQIDTFLGKIRENTESLKKNLRNLLPKIRSQANGDESELRKVLSEKMEPPFHTKGLFSWLKGKEDEITTLSKLIQILTPVEENIHHVAVISTSKKSEEACTSESLTEHVVELKLMVPRTGVQYLDAFLGNRKLGSINEECWYKDRRCILNTGTRFHSFAALAKSKQAKCIVTSYCIPTTEDNSPDSDQKEGDIATIVLHSNGTGKPFDLPSKPRDVMAHKIDVDSVEVKWKEPAVGSANVISYLITYQCSSDESRCHGKLRTDTGNERTIKLQGHVLGLKSEYTFSIQAESELGLSESSRQVKLVL